MKTSDPISWDEDIPIICKHLEIIFGDFKCMGSKEALDKYGMETDDRELKSGNKFIIEFHYVRPEGLDLVPLIEVYCKKFIIYLRKFIKNINYNYYPLPALTTSRS